MGETCNRYLPKYYNMYGKFLFSEKNFRNNANSPNVDQYNCNQNFNYRTNQLLLLILLFSDCYY